MDPDSDPRPPRHLENSLLVMAAMLAQAPLCYQLPRWAKGLDPTFVHPTWIERSPFPFLFQMPKVHPLIWMGGRSAYFRSPLPELWLEIREEMRI
jgi:hypothetical protein